MPIETNNLFNNYKEAIKTLTPPVTPKNNKPETENKTEDINPIIKDEFNKQEAQKPPINNAAIVYPTPLMEKVNAFTSLANVALFAGLLGFFVWSGKKGRADMEKFSEMVKGSSGSIANNLTKYTPEKGFGLDNILGMENVKEDIRKNIIDVFKTTPKELGEYGYSPPSGIILSGPPGNGKSFTVKAIAGELNADIYYMSGSKILSKYHGESEKSIAAAFEGLRQMAIQSERPIILCLEEADALIGSRNSGDINSNLNTGIVSTFLQELEKPSKNFLTIMTTNKIENIDSAAKRAGRVEIKIEIPNPEKGDFPVLLKGFIAKIKNKDGSPKPLVQGLLSDEKTLKKLAEKIYNDSGESYCVRDIEEIVNRAKGLAFSERAGKLTKEHLETAILDYVKIKAAEKGKQSNTIGFTK